MSNENITQRYVEVTAEALPLFCPTPDASLWNAHPRVAIPVDKLGEARCPYCGTLYKFKGDLPKGHH
ncbi:MAG: zinc-finger domain-containing protein [Sideroxydans sp.]|nr:zinc-finger domain-containing protein [Sideroxydans sp.]